MSKDGKAPIATRTDHAACGTCHQPQYDSFVMINYESKARIEKGTYKGRSPLFEKLMAPHGFADFLDFNDFLGDAEALLQALDLEGVLQVAPFHPRFQFDGTDEDDITNATNRSPYPTLHLIREDSIDRAVQAFPEAEAIYEANMQTLRRLGPEGWAALDVGPSADADGRPAP